MDLAIIGSTAGLFLIKWIFIIYLLLKCGSNCRNCRIIWVNMSQIYLVNRGVVIMA